MLCADLELVLCAGFCLWTVQIVGPLLASLVVGAWRPPGSLREPRAWPGGVKNVRCFFVGGYQFQGSVSCLDSRCFNARETPCGIKLGFMALVGAFGFKAGFKVVSRLV